MSMKRILLTGSNGFVGSYFLKKYNSSYTIDTFSFLNNNFINLDLSNVDVVIHCSALVHQMKGASWEQYQEINVNQTLQLAKKQAQWFEKGPIDFALEMDNLDSQNISQILYCLLKVIL